MIQINFIPSLVINQNGLFAKDKSGKLVDICLHQGSLDGACPDTPKTFNNYWNTVIDLEANSNNRKYFSRYIPNELNTEYDVSLDDILLITPIE